MHTIASSKLDPGDPRLADEAHDAFEKERDELAERTGYIVVAASRTVPILMEASKKILGELTQVWAQRTSPPGEPKVADDPDAPPPGEEELAKKSGRERLVALAEEYVASLVTMFVHQYVRPFRPLMTTAMGGSVLLLLLVASYVFEPRHLMMRFLWVLILGAAAVVGWIFVGLDKDELLSIIAKSRPGRVTVNRALVLRVLTWGALPILSLLAVQYPVIGDTLFFWLGPVFKSVH